MDLCIRREKTVSVKTNLMLRRQNKSNRVAEPILTAMAEYNCFQNSFFSKNCLDLIFSLCKLSSHKILKSYFTLYIISTMKLKNELCLPSFQICLQSTVSIVSTLNRNKYASKPPIFLALKSISKFSILLIFSDRIGEDIIQNRLSCDIVTNKP